MAQSLDAIYYSGPLVMIDHTPVSELAAGEVLSFGSGTQRLVAVSLNKIEAGRKGALTIDGIFKLKLGSGNSFSRGQTVEWDVSANEAVTNANGSGDFAVGVAVQQAASGDDFVLVRINQTFGEPGEGSSG